jgi:hypothetical protein
MRSVSPLPLPPGRRPRYEPGMECLEACDDSLVDALTEMAEWQSGARVTEEAGALFVVGQSRFPTPYSNAVFPVDATASPAGVLARAEALFADRRYFVWERGAGGGPLGEAARARGFTLVGDMPAMVIESPIPGGAAPGVEVRAVNDAAGFADFLRVSQLAYAEAGLPDRVAASLFARPEVAMASSVIAVGRIEGEPVSAALSITNGVTGVGGVYWVGTPPALRRRGGADAVTRFVTNAAFEQGACIVSLQASEAGEPVYTRLGYREVGRYARWLSPARAPG